MSLHLVMIRGSSGANILLNTDDYPMREFNTTVEARLDKTPKVQQDGIWPGYSYLSERSWEMEGDILGSSAEDYMQKRMNLFGAFLPATRRGIIPVGELVIGVDGLSDDLTSQFGIDSMPDAPVSASSPAYGPYHVQLSSFDPRCYADSPRTVSTGTPNITQGGLVFPRTFPISFPIISGGGQVTINNPGNADTLKIISRIYGPTKSPRIQYFDVSGAVLEISLPGVTIPSGSYVMVNHKDRKVTWDDGTNLYSALDHRNVAWWGLWQGNNIVNYTAFEASTPSRVEFEYYPAYMI